MKFLVLAAKLVEVPDDVPLDHHYIQASTMEEFLRADTAPYEKITFAVPTAKGWFTFWEMRTAINVVHNWVRQQIGQPQPVPTHPRQMWLNEQEREAYDESLK